MYLAIYVRSTVYSNRICINVVVANAIKSCWSRKYIVVEEGTWVTSNLLGGIVVRTLISISSIRDCQLAVQYDSCI